MRPVYTLPPNLEKLTKKQLERRKEKTLERIEELEIDISVSVGIMMDIIKEQDKLKFKIPLVTHQPTRAEYDARYNKLEEERKIENKKYQDLKHELDTLHYNLDELSIRIDTIQDYVDQPDY